MSSVAVGSVRALRNMLHVWYDCASASVTFCVSSARMWRSFVLSFVQAHLGSYAEMSVAHRHDLLCRGM